MNTYPVVSYYAVPSIRTEFIRERERTLHQTQISSLKGRIDAIVGFVSNYMDVHIIVLNSRSREGRIPRTRFLCWHFVQKLIPNLSYRDLGRIFDPSFSHCSVLHGLREIENQSIYPAFKEELRSMEDQLLKTILDKR
jgi:chromosomal replication initiation ATPase DnaA